MTKKDAQNDKKRRQYDRKRGRNDKKRRQNDRKRGRNDKKEGGMTKIKAE